MFDFEYLTIFVIVLAGVIIFFWGLIDWKRPLSQMNRARIYDRRSLRTNPDNCKNSIAVRSFHIDKERYIALRTSFLGMKMGYAPTDIKIDKLLKRLETSLAKTSDCTKKTFIELDIEILTRMKEQLVLGTVRLENYESTGEEKHKMYGGGRIIPAYFAFMLTWLFAAGMIKVLYLGASVTAIEPAVAVIGYLALLGLGGISTAERVLRCSRSALLHRLTHLAQAIIIGGVGWVTVWFIHLGITTWPMS